RRLQADEADELAGEAQLGCPKAPPTLGDLGLDALRERVARFAVQARREKLHHLRIRVHLRKRREIRVAPLPQPQTLGIELQNLQPETLGSVMPNLPRS